MKQHKIKVEYDGYEATYISNFTSESVNEFMKRIGISPTKNKIISIKSYEKGNFRC